MDNFSVEAYFDYLVNDITLYGTAYVCFTKTGARRIPPKELLKEAQDFEKTIKPFDPQDLHGDFY